MELQLEQQMISCLIPCVDRSVEERFSTDFVVPDSLPDAAELLLAEGDLCIWRLDLSGGNAELEGEISARICYTDESGSPESFPVSVPVQLRVRDDAIASGQRPFLRCRVKTINAHLLNSRKVRVQGAVQCVLVTYGASEIAVTTGFAPCEQNIYERKAQIRIPYISAVEEQVITTEERLPLQQGVPRNGRMLSYTSAAVTDQCECSDQRITVKGRICTNVLYLNVDGSELISETLETPFSGILDVGGEVSGCRLSLHLTSEEIRCCNDDPAVDTAFHLLIQAICYAEQEKECVVDAYCNRAPLTLNWKEQSFPELVQSDAEQYAAEGEIPCEMTGKTVCAVRAACQSESISATVLLRDENQRLSSLNAVMKTECAPDRLDQPSAEIGAKGLQVRVPFVFHKDTENLMPLKNLVFAEMEEVITAPPSGVSLVRREENADLWELAKANRSSVHAIQTANPGNDQKRKWLVIPHLK